MNKVCDHCGGPLVHMIGEGVAYCNDCKAKHTFSSPSTADNARAKKRSLKLGTKQEDIS